MRPDVVAEQLGRTQAGLESVQHEVAGLRERVDALHDQVAGLQTTWSEHLEHHRSAAGRERGQQREHEDAVRHAVTIAAVVLGFALSAIAHHFGVL